MKYKWLIKEYEKISKDFLHASLSSEIVAKLLLNRGIDSPEKAKSYLEPKFYKESAPGEIPNLTLARDRIIEAINKKEKITIFGDYDVDGVTSTSCMLITLRQFTDKVDFYIPNRLTEGYGLNIEAVKTIAKKNKKACPGTPLLITCDCGITNHKEIELATELGMDVIVTDHHSLPEVLPKAYAVLNPKLLPPNHKLHWLPGVGVAYKLAETILESLKDTNNKISKDDLLDLVALGMIADLAPLVDENRYLVQIGLQKLASTEKAGLKELLRMCGLAKNKTENGKNPTTEHVGFGIAPRINAVGRLTDAARAVKLLTTDDLFEAVQVACELEAQNRQRQVLCEETLKEAVALVSEQVDLKSDKCIVLANENWHHGVVGIVASRIVEKFSLPTILIAIDKEQDIARGSGRSIEQLNIVDAVVKSSQYLERFGGHKAACGLSVKPVNIDNFIFEFKNHVNDLLAKTDIDPILKIDLELPIASLSIDLINTIYKLSPFGLGNPLPLFVSEEVEIVSIRNIGKNGQHLKLVLKADSRDKTFEALIWNHDSKVQFDLQDKIKIAYIPKINNYNSEISIQLEIKDWQLIEQNEKTKKSGVGKKEQEAIIELYDFREKMQECLNLFSLAHQDQVIYFAEVSQKDYLPLKTYSRNNITKAESLVFLEIPPDKAIFIDTIKKSQASRIYFAFIQVLALPPPDLLKRLIGMLRYAKSTKDSKVNEIELMSALGINRTALAFALEILTKIGFLAYKKINKDLSINISTPARQNYFDLIEYNLFASELRDILNFKKWFCESDIEEIAKILKEQNIFVQIVNQKAERVLL